MASFPITRVIDPPLPRLRAKYTAEVTLSDGRVLELRTTSGPDNIGLAIRDVDYSFVACSKKGAQLFLPEIAEKLCEFLEYIVETERNGGVPESEIPL